MRRVLLMVLLTAEGRASLGMLVVVLSHYHTKEKSQELQMLPRQNILLGIRLNYIGGNVIITYNQRPRLDLIITMAIMWRCVHIFPLIVCPASQFSDISQIGNFPTKLTSNTFCAARKWEMLKRNTMIYFFLGKSGSKSPYESFSDVGES